MIEDGTPDDGRCDERGDERGDARGDGAGGTLGDDAIAFGAGAPDAVIDLTSPAFARRLAHVLAERRRQRGLSLRKLARQSDHAFTARDLHELEAARAELDEHRIESVVKLYGADIDEILRERVGLAIRSTGVLSTSGLSAPFIPNDSTSLLLTYLKLIRQLRAQQQAPAIELRREDVEVLAEFIGETGSSIVDRLGALMGATMTQRRAMAGMFLAGAVVIGLAGGSVAAISTDGNGGTGGTYGAGSVPSTALVILDEHGATVDDGSVTTVPSVATVDIGPVTTDEIAAATTVDAIAVAPATTAPSTGEPGEPGDGYPAASPTADVETTIPDAAAATTPQLAPPTPTPTPSPTTGTGTGTGTAAGNPPVTTVPVDDATTTPTSPTPTPTPTPTTQPSDVGAGGSIFDQDVPTEANPIPPIVVDAGKDNPTGDPTDTGTDTGDVATGDQATDAPPVPLAHPVDGTETATDTATDVAAWQVLTGDATTTDGAAVRASGFARVQAVDTRLVDGTIAIDATLINGPGFGVYVRSQFDDRSRVTSGWSVQVDTGWGKGALLVRRWSNDWEAHPVAVTDIAKERLYGSHTLVIDLAGDQLHARWNGAEVHLDLAEALRRLGDQWRTADGDQLALRTWGTTVLHVDRAMAAEGSGARS